MAKRMGADRAGPDAPQHDAVLGAVKAWPAEPGASDTPGATASLDGACARRHCPGAGRDEETVLRSNQEN